MTNDVLLRDVAEEDLPIFFEHQLDSEAARMAAFPARDRDAFMAHWARILASETIMIKTIATRALSEFLSHDKTRPLYAHVAKHNIASLRVLEKCGFTISGEDIIPSLTPGEEIEEFILILSAAETRAAHQPPSPELLT